MRENDDDEGQGGGGSLADGLGEVIEPGGPTSAEPYGDDTYGDGDTGDGVVVHDDTATDDVDVTVVPDDGEPLEPQAASPLEGVGYLIEQVRDALFGDDQGASADLDASDALAGDAFGLAGDGADGQHDAASLVDVEVDDLHHGGGDGGVIDA